MKNTLYKIRMLLLGVFVTLSVGALAQVGGGSGISARPTPDDPSFATLDVSGNSTLGGTLDVTGNTTVGGTLAVTGDAEFQTVGSPTANTILMNSSLPLQRWTETGVTADNRSWRMWVNSEQFIFDVVNDDASIDTDIFRVSRTGTTVDSINLQATDVKINGATAWHDVDSAGNGGGPLGIAYVRANSAGVIQKSSNVDSLTNEVGSGWWTVNFTANTFNAMPTCTVSPDQAGMAYTDLETQTSYGVKTLNTGGTLTDMAFTMVCLSME